MSDLTLKATGIKLEIVSPTELISGESDLTNCIFTFDEAWVGFTKTAVFFSNTKKKKYIVLGDGNTCEIPWEALIKSGTMCIGLIGINAETVMPTNYVKVPVSAGTDTASAPLPTEDVYLQIVNMMQQQYVDSQTATEKAAAAAVSASEALSSEAYAANSEVNAKASENTAKAISDSLAGTVTAANDATTAANTAADHADSVANTYASQLAAKAKQVDLETEAQSRVNDINVVNARMDTFTKLGEGSTTGDAELADTRVDIFGSVHPSAGSAVRKQLKDIASIFGMSISKASVLAPNNTYNTYYINTDGNIQSLGESATTFNVKEYYVEAGKTYNLYALGASLSGSYPIASFKASSGTSGTTTILLNSTSTPADYNMLFTAPSNGYLFIASVSVRTELLAFNTVVSASVAQSVAVNTTNIAKQTSRINTIYLETPEFTTTWLPGYWTASGELNTYSNYGHTDYIDCKSGQRVKASGLMSVGGAASAVSCIFTDTNHNFICAVTTQNAVDVIIDSGLDADYQSIAYVSFCTGDITNTSSIVITIENQDTVTSLLDDRITALEIAEFTDKNVYCLSDSIGYLPGSWVFQLAGKIGAKKVINLARGGATWKDKGANQINYDSSCAIWNNPLSVTTSADGKTISFDGNSGLANGNLPTDNFNYTTISNEYRFMKRLINEFGYPAPDSIIIACGINDTNAATESYSDSAFATIFNTACADMTLTQKSTLSGGLRWCIETLMTEYPNAEIMLATPLQSAYNYLRPYIKNTCKWIEAFHAYYSTKFIDAYSESGISAVFEKGWTDNTYVSGTTNAGRYLYDGLHPNDGGKIVQGNFMAKKVKIVHSSKV